MTLNSSKLSVALLAAFFLFNQCGKNNHPKTAAVIPAYNASISAFTSGIITAESTIKVRLSSDYPGEISTTEPVRMSVFRFEPSIEGKAYWLDNRTLEFRPADPLPAGTSYQALFLLDNLYPDKKKDSRFEFSFNVIPLNLDVDFLGMKPYSKNDLSKNRIEGRIRSTDKIGIPETEQLIVAVQDGRNLPVSWDHEGDGKSHTFTVDSVSRTADKNSVTISWDGNPAGIDVKGSRDYEIPSLGSFILMDQEIVQQPEQHILLRFSDPLLSSQVLDGLITLSNNASLKFSVTDNEIQIFPVVRQYGTLDLILSPGIKNIQGYTSSSAQTLTLNFEELKPAVRLIGQGVILPESNGLLFPFEAVNLKAVDVKIIKIFEDNIAQFLQVNSLDGDYEMKRAGRLILKKTVDLIPERPINFGQWNAFSLDLSRLIRTDPGAIYRVELSIRKRHSLYPCPRSDDESGDLTRTDDPFETIDGKDLAYWDATTGYEDYNYEYEDYDWKERNDPCTDSYFKYYERKVSRNILASNLGIIAKQGEDKSLLFIVTDIRTAEPVNGVKLGIFNYQNQLLGESITDNEGIASFSPGQQPFLLIARKDDQRGYLRLDQNSALSFSQFDIQGSRTEKGVKGFIYGERGVWRPGDTIHVSFLLNDKINPVPDDHPVIFELSDPTGKIRKKITRTQGMNGFYYFPVTTSPDDPTGLWEACVSIGGLKFYKSLRVETVKPNRLKITLDFGTDMIPSEGNMDARLDVKWLHGAIAGNMKARIEVNYTTRNIAFEGYPGYSFNDISKSFQPEEKTIFEGKTNEEGIAEFDPSFDLENRPPGMLNAIFTTRVFEAGGDFSIDGFSIPYSPYPVYIGVKPPAGDRYDMLLTDTIQTFSVISLNEKGKPVSRNNLDVRIYKLDWRWWWHGSDENLASYTGNSNHEPIYHKTIKTGADGKGNFTVKISYPDWGRFLVLVNDPQGGHSVSRIVYFDWPGYVSRDSRKDPQAASILPFSSDKKSYKAGETAVITIPTGSTGHIFLSIENGTKVLSHYWLKAGNGETTFSFTVTPAMAPNVYINVSLLQPHAQTKNDLPVRMYGIIPITVEDPVSHLQPVISMPEVIRPESESVIEVKEKNGRGMTYTVAIVDEGLLDLTRFATPDPWHAFFAREALGVKTFDLYDFVLGAYGGRIDGIFSIGGDGDNQLNNSRKKANRFPPVVKFLGPFQLKPGETNRHKVYIRNYTGSVRTMVVAADKGAYGSAEKTTPVRKPLMVISTLPRVLGPGETVSLPVTVFALEDHVKDVDITIEATDLFDLSETAGRIHFDKTGDQNIEFPVRVKEKTGIGRIRVSVRSRKESAYYETELEVRSPNPEITDLIYGMIDPGESWNKPFTLPGITGTNKGILEVSSIPPMDFGRHMRYLLSYPHGCIEQVTSAAFPQLYLDGIIDMTDQNKQVASTNIKAAIGKLGSFQLSSGGFAYWPSQGIENEWGTCYGGHFLLEARDHGYDVPVNLLQDWMKYQRKAARKWRIQASRNDAFTQQLELIQAYRLYTLSLAGEPEMGAMNRLRETPGLNYLAKWRLAAAYVLAGQHETAISMVQSAETGADRDYTSDLTFGSALRDRAMILETMNLLGFREEAVPLIKLVSEKLSSENWYSTQTTAYALVAVAEFLGKEKTSKKLNYDFRFGDEKWSHAATNFNISEIHRDFSKEGNQTISVTNRGKGVLFTRLALTGTPVSGKEEAEAKNIRMDVEYRNMDGSALDPGRLEQGRDFLAVITIVNPGIFGNLENLALTEIFPSGWEIQNTRMFGIENKDFEQPDYQDIRDDRIYSYFNIRSHQTRHFAVKITATYKGRFYLPATSCIAMYNNDISAVVPGKWVEVVAPGE